MGFFVLLIQIIMKHFFRSFAVTAALLTAPAAHLTDSSLQAQGWPAEYGGVMLQGFYWDSFVDTQWSYLEEQVDDMSLYFSLIWIPQSGYCGAWDNMGYMPQYYFDQRSTFGTEGQLRSMINAFKDRGTGMIADVVINHRNNLGQNGSWVDFPAETYNGETYQMLPTDVVRNDDNGGTLNWANQNGVAISSNNDTGEGWDGCRDIDHKSENVNKVVKAYLSFLLDDLGYAGFRYDMVKGYSASFTADYNTASKPTFSVGEYWDSSSNIKRWIDGTKSDGAPTSAAFDFQFRYRMRDALKSNNFTTLAGSTSDQAGYPLIYQGDYKRYAVTFVENHDTEYRSASAPQDPLRGDTVAANAYMLAMPGTPCVFYKHWQTHKKELKLMIEARKKAGVTNTSDYEVLSSHSMCHAVSVKGTNGNLICTIGYAPTSYACPSGYTEILSGSRYRYYLEDKAVNGWNDIVARIDEEEQNPEFTPYDATVYVKADFTPVYFYIWDSNNNTQLNGNWPGKQPAITTIDGETWYYQSVPITSADYYFNIIFNQGNGKPQTSNITRISSDRYFIATNNGTSIDYEDVTSQYADLRGITEDDAAQDNAIYDLQGRRVNEMKAGQLYIRGGQKIMLR